MANKLLSRLKALNEDQNLVAHYKFSEGSGTAVGDSTNSGLNGTANGGMTWDKGRVGAFSGSFDGTDDHVDLPPIGISSTTDSWTIAAFVKVNGTSGNREIVANNAGSGSESGQFWFITRVQDGTNKVQPGFGIAQSGGFPSLVSNTALTPGRWHHVCWSHDGSRVEGGMKLYIDGVDDGVAQGGGAAGVGSGDDWIIGDAGGSQTGTSMMNGLIDDIRVYDRVLTAQEVQTLGNQQRYSNLYPQGEITNGLIGRWTNSRETIDTTLKDVSGKGNDGTLVGGVDRGVAGRDQRFALDFDGVDDAVHVPAASEFAFGTSPFTLSCWVKTTSTTYAFLLNRFISSGEQWLLAFSGAGASAGQVSLYTYAFSGGETYRPTSSTINDSSWHHIVAVRDGTNLRLYVDGALNQGTQTGSTNIDISTPYTSGNGTGAVGIGYNGYDSPDDGHYFDGQMDDIRIYDRALTPTEVQKLYDLYK